MRAAAALLLAACGRFGFDSRVTTSDGATDTAHDTSVDTTRDGPAVCGGLYCDDFEGSAFDPRWMLDTFNGTLTLDTVHVHSGTRAVHAHIDPILSATTNARATLLSFDGLPVTGTIYVRMWAFIVSPRPVGFFDQIINLADAAGDGMSMGAKDGFIANNDYTAPPQYTQSAVDAEPVDGWVCLTFQMPSGVAGTSRVFQGGSELTDIAQTVASPQPAPTHVYLGTEWVGTSSSQAATDTWIDDVELATTPISCN